MKNAAQKGGGAAKLTKDASCDFRLPSLVFRPKRRGFTGGTWFRPSDRARPALRCRNGVSAETPAIEKGVRDVVTYADMFTYTLVLIGLASLVVTAFRHKK